MLVEQGSEGRPVSPIPSHTVTNATDKRMAHLDMIRGLAAIVVVVGHLRAFFLVDYGETSRSVASAIFYLATGFHHQAVIFFFVLSGFLVGGGVVRQYRRGAFQWSGYLVHRLCRLWIVIVPALLLTALWDLWGAHVDPAAYAGRYLAQFDSGPSAAYDLSPLTYLGNIAFLQTIAVPAYGSNGPLWSLANEFWYYILFPLAAPLALRLGTLRQQLIGAIAAIAVALLLPVPLVTMSIVWLFGVGAFLAWERVPLKRIGWLRRIGLVAAIDLVAFLLYSRVYPGSSDDFVIGLLFAATVPWLARAQARSRLYRNIGFGLSEMSYTL